MNVIFHQFNSVRVEQSITYVDSLSLWKSSKIPLSLDGRWEDLEETLYTRKVGHIDAEQSTKYDVIE